ncbi:putative PEP-CTERM system histidine kinase [Sphingomonas sp. NFR04]|uniref:XrtA/PEP-CTERM system histidine kinase PrsK n=1 Tax=Sphingomonas sp. NFR04 TaxID=1566283 RepID=UPI0008E269D9|nr:XrtA/PEP-CTERM system histidine kinase PrsK [Sphingomonas sp. NFR04]SFJ80643.1 putative PEP-CTERM system histidine kinase [Sphingomonas sp. NFR04]
MLTAALSLWLHALAALLFALLPFAALRTGGDRLPRRALAAALGLTALAALATAGIGAEEIATRLAETLRTLAWLAFLLLLHRRAGEPRPPLALGTVYGVVALVTVAAMALDMIATNPSPIARDAASVALLLNLLVAVGVLVMVQALHSALAHTAGGGLRWTVAALGGFWLIEFAVLTLAYLGVPMTGLLLVARGAALVCVAAAMGLGLQRRGDWRVRMSRTVAYQSLTLVAVGAYFVLLALATSALATLGGAHARLLQTAFVFGATAAILALVSNSSLRGWVKVKLAKHLFRHRYDYRAEWLRFTETLGAPGAAPLDQRIVRALADLTASPSGLLLVAEEGGLVAGAGWHWDRATLPLVADQALATHLETTGRIIEVDAVRLAQADAADADATPGWMREVDAAWVVVPLLHRGALVGAILLGRPALARRLDWEDFDLLKAAGRQVASYLAEARAQEALAEAQRFDEFNRRFAFLLHDIKNLVSQLALTARNAERHADNPAFRADMIATLRDSSDRLNALLARLGQHHRGRSEPPRPTPLLPLLERLVARQPGQVRLVSGAEPAVAIAEPAALEQLLVHLIQNAIEASPADAPVTLALATDEENAIIDVIDRGCGMSPGFVRNRLFKPFTSSKPGGFGLGTFEAQQLAQGMGGRITVSSREGQGTRFRVVLRAAPAVEAAA